MRSYWILMVGMGTIFLALFGVVQALHIPLLHDPQPYLDAGGRWGAAAIGVALLVGDVLLPIPASLVMIAHGALFGVALGTLLSLVGGVGAGALAFALGRSTSGYLHRFLPADERSRGNQMLGEWGAVAVIATRPVPILAESVALLAGTSTTLPWPRFLLATVAGNVPAALLYALTGATAARFDNILWTFGLVLLIAGSFWFLGRMGSTARTQRENIVTRADG